MSLRAKADGWIGQNREIPACLLLYLPGHFSTLLTQHDNLWIWALQDLLSRSCSGGGGDEEIDRWKMGGKKEKEEALRTNGKEQGPRKRDMVWLDRHACNYQTKKLSFRIFLSLFFLFFSRSRHEACERKM